MALRVVAGFLKKENKFLLVKRPLNKNRGGFWEFPGGKVENGETLEEAIKRELKEELGIETEPKRILGKVNYKYPDEEIELILFEMEFNEEPILKEALELKWISFEEVKNLEFCPADRELFKILKENL